MQKKNSKNNLIRDVYGFLAFQIVFVLLALLFTGFSVGNFFMALIGGILLALALMALKSDLGGKRKNNRIAKRPVSDIQNELEFHDYRPDARNPSRKLVRLEKKNFNWSSGDISRNKRAITNSTVAEQKPVQIKKEEEKERKFIPYRSPFEPINPPRNAEREKTDEVQMADNLDVAEADIEDTYGEDLSGVFDNEEGRELNIDLLDLTAIPILNEIHPEDRSELHEGAGELIEFFKADEEAAAVVESAEAVLQLEEECVCDAVEETFDEANEIEEEPVKDQKVVRIPVKFKNNIGAQTRPEIIEEQVNVKEYNLNIEHVIPSLELLNESREAQSLKEDNTADESAIITDANAKKLIDTLASFGVGARILDISQGPSVTRYELQPNAGVKVSKIVGLSDDIALNLAATGVRIEAPIPGKAAVGIEVPNKEVKPVLLRDVIESEEFRKHQSKIAFAVGKDVAGRIIVGDIAKMPHLLIAGATGSGKSVCINTLIASILYKASPSEVKLLMVDPKVVELGIYNGIPHLLIPVVTDPKKAAGALSWAVVEMTNRYKLFAENNVRDLKGYNALMKEKGEESILPQIVIIIDELADLMMVAPNDVEDCICRLAQMARAAGMHLVVATQRPSVDVITGVIKANIPSRISFAVSSQIDSRTILDMAGAEKLLGRGDMLFNPIGEPKPIRVQGGFISDKEVEAIVAHLKAGATAEYDEEILERINSQTEPQQQADAGGDDELLPQAIVMVLDIGQASASLIQRKFKVGYSRAARILDQMEAWGVVGRSEGSKPRQILITKQEWEELNS